MKFSPGDKVAFINEKQNGVVMKSFPGGKVLVEIEDGFEIEVYEKELVKTESNVSAEVPVAEVPVAEAGKPVAESEKPLSLLALCDEGSICFAGVPAATGAVLTGMVNYFLINNSEYDLVYTFFNKKKNKVNGISRGVLDQHTAVMLDGFRREDLTDIESFILEALLFDKEKRPSISHIRKEVGVLLPGIASTNPGVDGVAAFAKMITLFSEKEPEQEQIKDLIGKLQTKEKPVAHVKQASHKNDPGKYGIIINEKVVDLHIEELQTDFSNLSNAEMIAIQLNHLTKEMNDAIRKHYKRIIFIHGVGNGVLKNEVRKELKHYTGITVRDGDFAKYGRGATEVIWE